MQLSQRFPKKRAFITGAGSGLGKQLALQLAAEGWSLGLTDINGSQLENTVSEVEEAGGRAYPFVFDVSDSDAYQKVAAEFCSYVGIDLLINNAGVGDASMVDAYSPANWKWITGINQLGVIYGCHFFIPFMKQQRAGHIINIASAAAFSNLPEMGPYNTTKAAVVALSETLRVELKPQNIGVTVVMPSFFQTNINQFARGGDEVKELNRLLMLESKLAPDRVANIILKAAGRNQFRVLIPGFAKLVFWVSRWFPGLLMFIKTKLQQRKNKLLEHLRKKYGDKV